MTGTCLVCNAEMTLAGCVMPVHYIDGSSVKHGGSNHPRLAWCAGSTLNPTVPVAARPEFADQRGS